MKLLIVYLAISTSGGVFFQILHHGHLPGDITGLITMFLQGLLAAGVAGILGPYFLLRRGNRPLQSVGAMLWLAVTLMLLFGVYWSMTCCGA